MKLLKSIKEKLGGKSTDLWEENLDGNNAPENYDALMNKARMLYFESSSFSISILQEQFNISYVTAARVMEQLEEEGLFEDDDDGEGEDWITEE